MLYTFPIAILFEIGFPILLAFWFVRRHAGSWKIIGVGALVFAGSQVLHIPFLNWLTAQFSQGVLPPTPPAYRLIFNATLLGLLAGLFEETARVIAYWALGHRARDWRAGVSLGIGHGGLESAGFVGLTALSTFIALVIYSVHPSTFDPLTASRLQAALAEPWHLPLAGALERASALALQVTLSVMVLQVFVRRNALWYLAAVLWHALVDFFAVILSGIGWNPWANEGILVLFGLVSLVILFALIRAEKRRAPVSEPFEVANT